MYQNNLTRNYQNYVNQPIHYMNNQMLNNNPIYASNIYDQNFYQQMRMAREEQMRRVKNISDLNLSKEQITEYVIAPIKIESSDASEIQRLFDEEAQTVTKDYIEKNWWNSRTNAPYKTILRDEDWKRDFKSKEDLIVHKVTDLDKIGLMDDYKKLVKLLEKHNNELKVIYSASKENEYKKKFKHVNKYKYKMTYDPKDYNDLKNYYKKEQKKHDCEQKRIDELITIIMDDEDIDESEIKQIETEFMTPAKSKRKRKKNREREKEIDRQLQELIDEYGEDALKELEAGSNSEDDQYEDQENKERCRFKRSNRSKTKDKSNSSRSSKVKRSKRSKDEPMDNNSEDKKPKRNRITINRKKKSKDRTGSDTKLKNGSDSPKPKSERRRRAEVKERARRTRKHAEGSDEEGMDSESLTRIRIVRKSNDGGNNKSGSKNRTGSSSKLNRRSKPKPSRTKSRSDDKVDTSKPTNRIRIVRRKRS